MKNEAEILNIKKFLPYSHGSMKEEQEITKNDTEILNGEKEPFIPYCILFTYQRLCSPGML